MEYYLNFDLTGEPNRFHVALPWINLHTVNFNTLDAHLKSVVPATLYERTRKLKPSPHRPEPNSVSFHDWLRQTQGARKQTRPPNPRTLERLVGGRIEQAGITQEGYPYLIVQHPETAICFYVIAQANSEDKTPGFLQITENNQPSR